MFRVTEREMKRAFAVSVFTTREHGALVNHLAVVDQSGDPILFEDGSQVMWSGRSRGLFIANAEFLANKYNLPGDIDTSRIIKS